MRIALTGNPNSGKTSMFNALTGKNEKVGNWAGVTVEKKESAIKKNYSSEQEIVVVDLPGAYSMSPFTSEESVTSTYVMNENPDVIINIVDATNLSRSLFFTTQLLELGIPMVVALNKSDINQKKKTKINVKELSKRLNCPVIETVSRTTNETGLEELITKAISLVGKEQKAPYIQKEVDITNKDAVLAADKKRFHFVNGIVKAVERRKIATKDININDKIDNVITNPFAGIIIFIAVMWFVFWVSQASLGPMIGDYISAGIEKFGAFVEGKTSNARPILQTILVDGIIGGVGAVLGFLPLVMIMYFLLALLEDCGYMARVSVILDPIFKKVGLSGKSVIPIVVGTGCAVPGIMACRTIRDERQKRATAMLTPFIPCGAKIPIIALFAGAFFPKSNWVAPVVYFVGILLILIGALLVKAVTGCKYKKSYFIIEMPNYKMPSFRGAAGAMLETGKSYIIKAGTIILICNSIISIMASYTWTFAATENASDSILASIASPIAVLLVPLGFGMWQLAAAAITGFIAKEEVVGTLGAVFALSTINETELLEAGMGAGEAMFGITAVAGLAYLMFNLYTPPCFAAIGAMNAEMKSKKWLFAGLGLQISMGYIVSFLVYQIGTLIVYDKTGDGLVPGIIAVSVMILAIVVLAIYSNKKAAAEYATKNRK